MGLYILSHVNALIILTAWEDIESPFILFCALSPRFSHQALSVLILKWLSVFFFSLSPTIVNLDLISLLESWNRFHVVHTPRFYLISLPVLHVCPPYVYTLSRFLLLSKTSIVPPLLLVVSSSPGSHWHNLPKINFLFFHVHHLILSLNLCQRCFLKLSSLNSSKSFKVQPEYKKRALFLLFIKNSEKRLGGSVG